MPRQFSFSFTRKDFPVEFLFGVATSAYQIEGSKYGGCGRCHWDDFAATPGNVINAENGSVACNHYERWQEDLDLIKKANLDCYRFSTSWARILPDGTGPVNQKGLDFYDKLVDGLLERDIKPFLCLYHWELPSALCDLGGWRNDNISDWFADYTQIVMQKLGDRVYAAATFNEPWCIAWLSHFLGHHAPGLRDIRAATRAMHHILVAHGKAVSVMRDMNLQHLGIVLNFEYPQPANDSKEALEAAKRYDGIYNRWFLGGLFNKQYPEDIAQYLEPYLPRGYQNDFNIIAQPLDWLGINYYTRCIIDADPTSAFPALKTVEGPLPKTAMNWEIFPEGLYSFLDRIHKDYTKDLPLYITENGLALSDKIIDNKVSDIGRIDFLDSHLQYVQQAIMNGIPIMGYFTWSLLDNYEWAFGYEKRFGIIHVDFKTHMRTPKESYYALQKMLEK